MLQSSTCRFFSAAIDQLHLVIEVIIGSSTPYPLFSPWFLLWLSSDVCYHHSNSRREICFFAAGHLSPSAPFFAIQFLRRFAASLAVLLVFSPVLPHSVLPFGRVACYSSTWCRATTTTLCFRCILDFGAVKEMDIWTP